MAKLTHTPIILLCIWMNLCTVCAKAQSRNDDDRTFRAGLTLGTNFTQVDGDNFAGYYKVGINGAAVVYAKLADQIMGGLEMSFTQKGARAAGAQVPQLGNDLSTVLTEYKINLNYLEVPVTINYFDQKENNFGLGIAYGQLIGSKETYRDGSGTLYENDAKLFPFRKMDVNIVANTSIHIWKGLAVNIRYAYSMMSIRNARNFITGRAQQYNNLWTTRLIYTF